MAGLPRRDLWLLPLIAACTVLGLLAGAEALARVAWPGWRFRPDCRSRVELAEGPRVDYAYNCCGYRSDAEAARWPTFGRARLVDQPRLLGRL
jgi:hypothetical protein